MPYANEHAARLKDPDQYERFTRKNNEGGEGVDFVYGIKEGNTELQAVRFSKEKFSPEQARAWLKEHNHSAIEFEEASGKNDRKDSRQQREIKTTIKI